MISIVKKRNGKVESFNPDKLNGWAEWACAGAKGVSWSHILTIATKAGYDGMTTAELQQALINACVGLIEENPEYEKVASKLFLANLRKEVYGNFNAPAFIDYYTDMVEEGHWEDMGFSNEALLKLMLAIDHERDNLFPYSGLRQMSDKYLMKNLVNGKIYETPQMLYMGLAMAGIGADAPLEDVIDFYDALSTLKVNLPTPILLGLRSKLKGFASCCVISAGDSVDSMDAAEHIAYKMVANRAGIGLEFETRSVLEPVKGGAIEHQGKLPYYKWLDRSIKANTQQARGGSATMQFTCFDPEIETLLRLRSQRVAEDNRIDTMDYSLAINNYFLQKLAKGEDIYLISPYYAPRAHKAFYSGDVKAFAAAYEAEVAEWITKKVIMTKTGLVSPVKTIAARELFGIFLQQRTDTGRIYCHRIDEANRRSTFKDAIRSSNLCQEIELPTSPFNHVLDVYNDELVVGEGETALCNLAGMVINRIETDEEFERIAYLLLKMVDNVITMQDYPFPSMRASANYRRSVGIGMINLAHAVAQQGLSYATNEGRTFIHKQAERMSYFLHKASIKLAEERGRCGGFERTIYSDGKLPHETANTNIDAFHDAELQYDWEVVRDGIAKHGMRHSVLEAYMPSESSSVTIGCTNGVELPRQPLIFKSSKQGDIPQLVPEYTKLVDKYEYAFDIPVQEYTKAMAVLQKFVGQSISFNMYYNYNNYASGKLPMKDLMQDFMFACKMGIKTMYYMNTEVSTGGSVHGQDSKDQCDSCTI